MQESTHKWGGGGRTREGPQGGGHIPLGGGGYYTTGGMGEEGLWFG